MKVPAILLFMMYRAALRTALQRRWAAAVPATLAFMLALHITQVLTDDTATLPELEQAIWALAGSLIAATALWTLSGEYYKRPMCRTCGADKTDCWGNLMRHHPPKNRSRQE